MAKNQFNLKSMTREQREALKDSYFRLYEQLKCVKHAAEQAWVSLKAATTWVKEYKANANKIQRESSRGPKPGTDRLLNDKQVEQLRKMLVGKDPWQYKLRFAFWSARAIRELIKEKFGVEMVRGTVCLYRH